MARAPMDDVALNQTYAHLVARAVHRERITRERAHDHQRDQLLGEVERPIVV